MTPRRRAALVLSGGFVVAGALVAPAAMVAADPAAPMDPSISIACVDRSVALLSVAESGLGLTSVTPLVAPPFVVPVPSTNAAVAVVTMTNPTGAPFEVHVTRDVDTPVALVALPGETKITAFDVAEPTGEAAGASVFRVTDPAGTEVALVASTGDCTPPAGWCEADRPVGAPIAADHADVCPIPGDQVLGLPELGDATEPVPTGKVVEGPDVLAAQLTQTPPPPQSSPPDAIVIPSPDPAPAPPPPPSPATVEGEQAAAPAGPQLARSGSQSATLSVLAAMMLGVGTGVVNLGRRRMDVELDNRAVDAMARIRAVSRPLD